VEPGQVELRLGKSDLSQITFFWRGKDQVFWLEKSCPGDAPYGIW